MKSTINVMTRKELQREPTSNPDEVLAQVKREIERVLADLKEGEAITLGPDIGHLADVYHVGFGNFDVDSILGYMEEASREETVESILKLWM